MVSPKSENAIILQREKTQLRNYDHQPALKDRNPLRHKEGKSGLMFIYPKLTRTDVLQKNHSRSNLGATPVARRHGIYRSESSDLRHNDQPSCDTFTPRRRRDME